MDDYSIDWNHENSSHVKKEELTQAMLVLLKIFDKDTLDTVIARKDISVLEKKLVKTLYSKQLSQAERKQMEQDYYAAKRVLMYYISK